MSALAFWTLLTVALVVTLCLIWVIYIATERTHRKLDNIYDATDGMRSRLEQHANDSEYEARKARDDRLANHLESKQHKATILRWMKEALEYLKGKP